jgi:hypothetical protein
MKWTETKNGLPPDNEEVMIKCRGIFHLAVFKKERNIFVTKEDREYPATEKLIWSALVKEISNSY